MAADTKSEIDLLASEIRTVNRGNGWDVLTAAEWHDEHKVPALLALIHSEVSEGLEAFRIDDQNHFLEEMADVVLRVLSLVGGLTDDFDSDIRDKIEKNRLRGYRHGGKKRI